MFFITIEAYKVTKLQMKKIYSVLVMTLFSTYLFAKPKVNFVSLEDDTQSEGGAKEKNKAKKYKRNKSNANAQKKSMSGQIASKVNVSSDQEEKILLGKLIKDKIAHEMQSPNAVKILTTYIKQNISSAALNLRHFLEEYMSSHQDLTNPEKSYNSVQNDPKKLLDRKKAFAFVKDILDHSQFNSWQEIIKSPEKDRFNVLINSLSTLTGINFLKESLQTQYEIVKKIKERMKYQPLDEALKQEFHMNFSEFVVENKEESVSQSADSEDKRTESASAYELAKKEENSFFNKASNVIKDFKNYISPANKESAVKALMKQISECTIPKQLFSAEVNKYVMDHFKNIIKKITEIKKDSTIEGLDFQLQKQAIESLKDVINKYPEDTQKFLSTLNALNQPFNFNSRDNQYSLI